MPKRYDDDFKYRAVKYYTDAWIIGMANCAKHFGISRQTLSRWFNEYQGNTAPKWRQLYENYAKSLNETIAVYPRLQSELQPELDKITKKLVLS